MFHQLSSKEIKRLMRQHGLTIALLAAKMNLTQKRVRQVRDNGVTGYMAVCDWFEAITGQNIYISLEK